MFVPGGYIGKRQPAGTLETKKCVDKLFALRAKNQGKGKAAQFRAASGRMIIDLEIDSRNLHPNDALFAECIRTFNEHTIDGRSWLYRLEASQMSQAPKLAEVHSSS